MFETYAIIVNGQVVEYPVNPRVWLAAQNCYNVPEYWQGGVLDGKTYVYCNNFAPTPPYDKNLKEVTPIQSPENGLWYRQYIFVDATPSEIAERTAAETETVIGGIHFLLKMVADKAHAISQLPEDKQLEWANYKSSLLALSKDPNFPWISGWPQIPDDGQQVNIGLERV